MFLWSQEGKVIGLCVLCVLSKIDLKLCKLNVCHFVSTSEMSRKCVSNSGAPVLIWQL